MLVFVSGTDKQVMNVFVYRYLKWSDREPVQSCPALDINSVNKEKVSHVQVTI